MNGLPGASLSISGPGDGGVSSPCLGICALDASGGSCTACLRTVEEIASWGRYTEAERRAVMAELAHRQGPAGR